MDKLEIEVEVFDKPHKVEVTSLVAISEDTINKDICNQAGLYAFYAEAAADVRSKRDMASQALKDIRCISDVEIRRRVEGTGAKSTEAKISAEVELDSKVVKYKDKVLALEGNLGKLDAILRALEHRKDMLVTLGANMRTSVETGGSLNINKRN